MKKLLLVICLLLGVATLQAQDEKKEGKTIKLPSWISDVKLSGYGMLQYQASTQKNAKANTFNIRMGRIALDGRILNDFYWKAQIQFNGNTSTLGSSPRLVDLFVEWQKYPFSSVPSPSRTLCIPLTKASIATRRLSVRWQECLIARACTRQMVVTSEFSCRVNF